jgi:hypothetical protein
VDVTLLLPVYSAFAHNVPCCECCADDADDVDDTEVPEGGQQGSSHHYRSPDERPGSACPNTHTVTVCNGVYSNGVTIIITPQMRDRVLHIPLRIQLRDVTVYTVTE